ncbi:MAG TPA: FecR family protein [Chloroflexota bacterium]|nr:FecR family protein [Chloroflexota bacterium]
MSVRTARRISTTWPPAQGPRRCGVALVLALGLLLGGTAPVVDAQRGDAALTVISGQVRAQPPGAASFRPAADGQVLPSGSRVRTAANSWATLTFFDGTTITLDPDSEVVLAHVEPAADAPDGLLLTLQLSAGRIWAQVSSLFDRGSSFEVQAAGVSAVAREGTFGFQLANDGTLGCWAIAGSPLVVQRGDDERVLGPEEQLVISAAGGALPAPTPREFGPGLLEVQTQGGVLARVVDPRGLTVGFASGEFVVNQVIDAATSLPSAPDRWLRVRGPTAGPYALVLQPEATGPYLVRVTLEREDSELAAYEWQAEVQLGEVLVADLVVEDSPDGPTGLRVAAPRPADGPLPGSFQFP